MFRVIYSTLQSPDVHTDDEERYRHSIKDALDADSQVRETYSCDDIGQKTYHLALLPYTDPTGARRWAVLNSSEGEVDWQDTDDLDEALESYEEQVRDTTAGALPGFDEDGEKLPVWDYTDVDGFSARVKGSGEDATSQALLQDALWAHEQFVRDEGVYQQSAKRRQARFVRFVDSQGRGGQALLAARTGLSEPTVKRVVDTGRKALDAQEPDPKADR